MRTSSAFLASADALVTPRSATVAARTPVRTKRADFDFETAKIWQDTRKPYPQARFVAIGYLDDRLHVLVFGEAERGIRVISFRKANPREGVKHGFALARD